MFFKSLSRIERKTTSKPSFLSLQGDKVFGSAPHQDKKSLFVKHLVLSFKGDRRVWRGGTRCARSGFPASGLEPSWREAMLLQQAVELGSVAVGQAGRVGHMAIGQLEQIDLT
ncbi:hypothetical protein P3G55_24805 [Leptospira sp. 96542]|nr:hypothetical protein [Leptospira sp. 96542]